MRTTCLLLLGLMVLTAPADARRRKRASGPAWHELAEPAAGAPEVIGSYAGGCMVGAVELPPRGVGFETIRRWRNRYYGHPDLARWLEGFGERVRAAGLPDILVGDASQPRGGRMKSGHRSHQVGLDVDLWFERPPASRRDDDKHFPSLVRGESIDRRVFQPRHVALLELAARSPGVERVFVNWVIKQELCASVEGDRSWLRRIRPWYGHDSHFHVRLACPVGSPLCRPQSALPPGDGCGEETWFSRAETLARRKKPAPAVARGRGARHTDKSRERCQTVARAPAARPATRVAGRPARGRGGSPTPAKARPAMSRPE
ncbi:MAG: penicillin-insensitive murein endopeptidase [Myxococcales bacterium]|nr:penicillin-insensitive murein endopeptidase [Myxococcales bacterium]